MRFLWINTALDEKLGEFDSAFDAFLASQVVEWTVIVIVDGVGVGIQQHR